MTRRAPHRWHVTLPAGQSLPGTRRRLKSQAISAAVEIELQSVALAGGDMVDALDTKNKIKKIRRNAWQRAYRQGVRCVRLER